MLNKKSKLNIYSKNSHDNCKHCESENAKAESAKVDNCKHCESENAKAESAKVDNCKHCESDKKESKAKHTHVGESCCTAQGTAGGIAPCCSTGKSKSTIVNVIFLAVSLLALLLSFFEVFKNIEFFHYVNIAYVAVILCGYPIFLSAYNAIFKRKKINASVLITTAIIASIVLEIVMLTSPGFSSDQHGHSYIFVAGEIAFLMAIGELIETFTIRKSRAGIERLIKLTPKTAIIESGNTQMEINVSQIKVDDIIIVRPGDVIAIDGIILSGSATINESSITGEFLPVERVVGEKVFGGCINLNGTIRVIATAKADEMVLTKIIKLVEEAEGKKAPISKIADRWASYIVPAAIVIAVLVGVFSALIFKITIIEAVIRAVTVLVVFCPCSLALAVPTAVSAGIGCGAKNGFLIKSGSALEILAKVNKIAFDKTGTLTKGEITVKQFYALGDADNLKSVLLGLEQNSTHPIAKAITNYINESVVAEKMEGFKIIEGSGVFATCKNITYSALSYNKLIENSIILTGDSQAVGESMLAKGYTVIGVVKQNLLIGLVGLSDVLREGGSECVEELKRMSITPLMLTGDNESVANLIAGELCIDEVHSKMLPKDKMDIIEGLKQNGDTVCMMGDGVNDAPSLASANCSVAFASLASQVAIEVADISLINSDIKRVPFLFKLARRTFFTIKTNIILSMIINVIAVVLSTMGVLDPLTGALVHNISSILVVVNSALILTKKLKPSKIIEGAQQATGGVKIEN